MMTSAVIIEKGKMAAIGVIVGLFVSVDAMAGTVTVERVVANEVRTREIGAPPPKPEILYYRFNMNEGVSVSNAVGASFTGTKSGCIWTNSGRYAGGSMYFDGVNDYVNVGAGPLFPLWDQYAVSVWFLNNGRGSAGDYGQKIIDKSYSTTKYWFMSVDGASGALGVKWNMTNYSPMQMVDSSSNYVDNAWHHAVVVRDGSNGWLWVDGMLKTSCTNMFAVNNTTGVYLGYSGYTSTTHRKCWSGLLDEVRVFDYALSPIEIADLYNDGFLIYRDTPVSITTNMVLRGTLTVTGESAFMEGVSHAKPLGDLSCGIYTNTP